MPCCLAKIVEGPTIKLNILSNQYILGFSDFKYAKGLGLEACVKWVMFVLNLAYTGSCSFSIYFIQSVHIKAAVLE